MGRALLAESPPIAVARHEIAYQIDDQAKRLPAFEKDMAEGYLEFSQALRYPPSDHYDRRLGRLAREVQCCSAE